MQTSRVLIIDDEPILLDTLASTVRLRLPDVHIERADSALASLERIRSIEYAAVLCDAHQPRMEGIAFVRTVRKLHPELPILLLIEKSDHDFIGQAMNAGAYDVLVKPVDEGTCLLAVQRAVEAFQLRGQVKREKQVLLATMRTVIRDLEVLYGIPGLQSHFEAFIDCVEADRSRR